MAFHISCPLTCRRICDCDLGFPAALRGAAAKERFWGEIEAVAEFLEDSWTVRERDDVAQVLVPRVARASAVAVDAEEGEGGGDDFKLSAIQQKAMTATQELEDYVRRLETGGAAAAASGEATTDIVGEEHGLSSVKIICRICLSGESEGTEKAIKMLPCKTCGKKYHKSCLKSWAANRDLFNWNSWSCPSCRLCEVCRRTGDPNKLMYCKRCDGAYHCYCQQPPHKNVGHGPYLCPKHTRCHSCDSTVPGSGPSTRWFLAHTCCDACGRLFVKGNYCPVCLKVYRDSEITPMVCCDLCERWVHCHCDGISDEKYQEFQSDQNLEYRCAACRGDCYQIIDMDDAVRELWKRKNITEHDLIENLRATAGLPPLDDTSYPNGEHNSPVIRKSDNIPLKFSVKGLGDNLLKNCSETGKNATNKKMAKKGYKFKIVGKTEEAYQDTEKQDDVKPPEASLLDQNVDDMKSGSDGPENFNFSTAESLRSNGTKSYFDLTISKQASRDPISIVPKVKIKRSKLHDLPAGASSSVHANKNKLVIHLGTRNANVSGSPKSETSSCQRDHEVAAYFGSEDTGQHKPKDNEECLAENRCRMSKHDQDKGVKNNSTNQIKSPKSGAKEKAVTKFAKPSNKHSKEKGNMVDASEINATCSSPQRPCKKNYEILRTPETENMKISKKLLLNSQDLPAIESKPSLKLKFKNPYLERSSWASQGEEENSVKGQRSKRKRPASNKVGSWQDFGVTQLSQENPVEETLDANWILKKLGKDAIGKRVEVQLSDSSWYPGEVADINHKTSSMSVSLDNGRSQVVELGKQVIRFIRQKHKRTKL